ncbi:MAG: hypothetical protein JNM63_19755 [Spirochaetia bacterium]|nr:hypothetical protein [Spirochaetia bacterium]
MRQKLSFSTSLVLAAGIFALSGCLKVRTATMPGRDYTPEAMWIHENLMMCTNAHHPGIPTNDWKNQRAFLEGKRATYRSAFVEKISAVLKNEMPRRVPKVVVYPFGGSDFGGALATFPEALEVMTISLESAGDPRGLPPKSAAKIKAQMAEAKKYLGEFFDRTDNSHQNVWGMENGILPAQLTFSIGEAAAFGLVPASLRFFRIESNGTFHYYVDSEIAALEKTKGEKVHGGWFNPKCQHAFLNMEIRYRRPDGNIVIHRHVSADLGNARFAGSPLETYLISLGKVSMMTKGASYLPWKSDFSAIKNYMCAYAEVMVSDSTGVLPWDAEKAGLSVKTFGNFDAAYVSAADAEAVAQSVKLRDYFRKQPHRDLAVRYGYSETHGYPHLLVYLPKSI